MPRVRLAPWQHLAVNLQPYEHFAFFGGVATGKTFTGSQFSVKMLTEFPQLTGFIGANTYDQLSQATLREFMYWLEQYKIDFVVDCRPPASWGAKKAFKSYKNILSARVKGHVVHVFTRVLSDENPLRGIEFSWYWLDETRDTPNITHDVVLSRMRESKIRRGIITTTTNGEDWAYERFVRNNRKGQRLYGSSHVATQRSVELGIIDQEYYDLMLSSYSPLMAEQELFARHVNVKGGIAYYAASEKNKLFRAPWGDAYPNPSRPLVVGCDFNFQPAPCAWMVGQVGPHLVDPSDGLYFSQKIHWFGEISDVGVSTQQMTVKLMAQYPDFFYQIFGDASGGKGTTSNAGETDYNQMGEVLSNANCLFSIDYDQANPLVKNRVENMNAMFKNGRGQVRQSYNPQTCPLFDGDVRSVGWKQNVMNGKGRLDGGGDIKRTHASDGAGYAVYKLFPPGRVATVVDSVESPNIIGARDALNT